MTRSQDRLFEALDYGKADKAKLTNKQYLVYSYLMSISKWNADQKEQHYYVYKNSFLVKDACQIIGITQPTWRAAIKKLAADGYNYIEDCGSYYTISIPITYAPLDIQLIKLLLPYGAAISGGGNIIGIYSVIYKYWRVCDINNEVCEITINQLRKIFNANHDQITLYSYKLMLQLFESSGLIQLQKIGKHFGGVPYTSYKIEKVSLRPTEELKESGGPQDIERILDALKQNID